jgi:hypothetical protein
MTLLLTALIGASGLLIDQLKVKFMELCGSFYVKDHGEFDTKKIG